VSRPYATDEQYERWFITECARCGRRRNKAGSRPDGHVCRTCIERAVRTRGRCPGCGQDRALPGRRPADDVAICGSCAGFSQSFACARCGFEDRLHAGRLCTRCTLVDRLNVLLDDGNGRIRPALIPLADLLLTMDQPRSGLSWLHNRKGSASAAAQLLQRLAHGQIELNHEAFHTLEPWRAATHLRDLLMACGVLPAVDRQLCLFERWLAGHLTAISDPQDAQIIRRYATWEVLPRLRTHAQHKPIAPGARQYAGDQVKQATAFLSWLRAHERTLSTVGQADLDIWHVEHNNTTVRLLRPFLKWCMSSKITKGLRLPTPVKRQATALPQSERIQLLQHVLTDPMLPLRSRVAAMIVLLYAQPLTRVVRLTVDDVIVRDGQVLLRLGHPPSPVPEPAAALLLSWIPQRDNMNTATNRDSRWLLPGRRTGQPLHPSSLAQLLNNVGIPTASGRARAIRQYVLELPAAVVADALGYHYVTTTKLAAEAGAGWSRYTGGDHLRSPAGWKVRRTGDS